MFMDCIDIIFYFSPPNLNYLPTPMTRYSFIPTGTLLPRSAEATG